MSLLHAQLCHRARQRRVDSCDVLVRELVLEPGGRPSARLFHRGLVNVLRRHRHVGDDHDSVTGDFEKQWDDRRNKLNEGLKKVTERARTVLEGFGDFDVELAAEIAASMQEV